MCIECLALFFALCLPTHPKDGRDELYEKIWGVLEIISMYSQLVFLVIIQLSFQNIGRYNYVFIAFCWTRLIAEFILCLIVVDKFKKLSSNRATLVVKNILGLLAIRKAERDAKEANATIVRPPTESHPEIAAEPPKIQGVGDVV